MKMPLEIIMFYSVAFIILVFLISRKTKVLRSVAISLSTVMVASEFWEIPIFVAGFLGVAYWFPYPSWVFLLHHLNIIMLFLWLVYIAKIEFLKLASHAWLIGLLFCTIMFFILPIPLAIWSARLIGLFWFGLGVYFGSSILGT